VHSIEHSTKDYIRSLIYLYSRESRIISHHRNSTSHREGAWYPVLEWSDRKRYAPFLSEAVNDKLKEKTRVL